MFKQMIGKKAQEENLHLSKKVSNLNFLLKHKKAQEEMIGFVLIVVVVSVILLIFLSFSLNDDSREVVESYEVESFLQSTLQHSTECRDNFEALDVRDLIYACDRNQACSNDMDSCEVLGTTLEGIIESSWPYGENRPVKGYLFEVNVLNESLFETMKGNFTGNARGSTQILPSGVEIEFNVYY